jgi:hypothetical protein
MTILWQWFMIMVIIKFYFQIVIIYEENGD